MSTLQESLDHALANEKQPVSAAVQLVIEHALDGRASDIHLEPTAAAVDVYYRIDGVLQKAAVLPKNIAENVAARVKVMARLITYRTDIPQDGRIRAFSRAGDLRVSILPTIHGEKAVIRIFRGTGEVFALEELGLPDEIRAGLKTVIERPGGTLLLTGPSGSGKTTTIYALLRALAGAPGHKRSIVTIEDPVEHAIPDVTQCQVNEAAGLTFSSGLKFLLRQDPEVIVVGEIRDLETAKVAIEAGLTGHLVISTVHSGTACGVFTRLLDMGIEPYLVTSAVTASVAQRLLRTLCQHCKRPATVDARFRGVDLPTGAAPHDPVGCQRCYGTGYSGRTPVAEMVFLTEELCSLILAKSTRKELEECARRMGMLDLWQGATVRLAAGETSIGELRRVVPLRNHLAEGGDSGP
jgi:type II secretory ATPase GspE/PulE/Tfp pilus assembly ATPase PilB-like protein